MNVHGYSAYASKVCRCEVCTAGAAEYRTRRRAIVNGKPLRFPCWFCDRRFATDHGRAIHQGIAHEAVAS
ncbi:MAG: hypothetical protein AB7G17_14030 [Phycisphaerales bacterium]